MTSPIEIVKEQQVNWAKDHGLALDSAGYTLTLDDNLFTSLTLATRLEFASADGGELGADGQRGKIQALHSSSALAVNVFQHWRDRDASVLASALGLSLGDVNIRFEQKFPTGLNGHSPNLDVVLTMADKSIVAIESKFLEPYGRHASGFREAYFPKDKELWGQYHYEHSQRLAESLQLGTKKFNWLHAEQLLKHILGLSYTPVPGGAATAWQLLYLWYEAPVQASQEHAAEAENFARTVTADGISFKVMTYQTLFECIRQNAGPSEHQYLNYLEQRYFGSSIALAGAMEN